LSAPGAGRARVRATALAAALCLLAAAAAAVPEVPELAGRVNDRAGLLSAEHVRALEARLAAFERDTTHQIVVLTVPSLEGEAIESFGIRVAEAWQIGHEDLDNGIIVIVSAGDRRARIEVGYGLEGVVPDAVAARILRERMIPRFREGRMAEGIARGVEALMAAARGEDVPPDRRPDRGARDAPRSTGSRSPGALLETAFFMGIVGGMVGGIVGRRRPLVGSGVGAGLAGVAGYLLTGALVGAAVAAFTGGFMGASGLRGRGRGVWLGGGGFGRGGFGGGGFGGGFGGGGGGFGGGGASGSW